MLPTGVVSFVLSATFLESYYAWQPPFAAAPGEHMLRPLAPMLYAVLLGGLGTLALVAGSFQLTRRSRAPSFEPPPAKGRATRPRP